MSNPTMYIFMRSDLKSLNPGKAMAQACHAANMIQTKVESGRVSATLFKEWRSWMGYRNFGRTLVLSVDKLTIEAARKEYSNKGLWVDVIDPTYPIDDGGEIHSVECHTCSGLFLADPPDKLSVWVKDPPNSDLIVDLPLHK